MLRKGTKKMALDDLDLEFEDEEEVKSKKSDAIKQIVDLEFSSQEEVNLLTQIPNAHSHAGSSQPMVQVKKIDDARASNALAKRRLGTPQSTARLTSVSSSPYAIGATALNSASMQKGHYDLESDEIIELRERALKAEFDADVRVQVAEFKTSIISELLSDMKLMDHQVNQLLVRIYAKHPDIKQEVLMIKKILADYTTKKRK